MYLVLKQKFSCDKHTFLVLYNWSYHMCIKIELIWWNTEVTREIKKHFYTSVYYKHQTAVRV